MCKCNASKCGYCGVAFDYFNGHECEGTRLKAELDRERASV